MEHAHAGSGSPQVMPDALNCYVNSAICAVEYQVETAPAPGIISYGEVRLGAVDVLRCEGSGLRRSNRKIHHIRTDSIDDVLIVVPLQANILAMQAGTSVQVGSGNFIYMSTAKPFSCTTSALRRGENFSMCTVRLPAAVLRQYVPRIDECCNHSIKLRGGASKIMLGMFEMALMEGAALSGVQAQRYGAMLIDAVANTTLAAPELLPLLSPSRETSHQRILKQAGYFIDSNLSNHGLTSDDIARHCRVSKRYMHAAFAANSTTIGKFILEQRLQQSKNALRDTALCDKSITEIAIKWGFNDPAYFSRVYKAHYGVTPSAERASSQKIASPINQ